MPCVLRPVLLNWYFHFIEFAEPLIVTGCDFLPSPVKFRKLAQLMQTDGCLNVRHIVFKSGSNDVVTPRSIAPISLPCIATHAVKTPHSGLVDEVLRASQHAAF